MKRILFFILFSIYSFLFAQTKNIIFRENYPIKNISSIKVNLKSENINAKAYNGDEFQIEVSSNNENLSPKISLNDDILTISSADFRPSKGDDCTISLYIPNSFTPEIYSFYTNSGNLYLENLKSQIIFQINGNPTKVIANNISSESFSLSSDNSYISITQLNCSYFSINSTFSIVELNLFAAPSAKSLCRIKEGSINLTIPRTENFEVSARSTHSNFINNFNKSIQPVKDWKSYINGNDGALIELQTFKGDITIAP